MTKTYQITEAKFSEAMELIRQNGGTVNSGNGFEVFGTKGNFKRDGNALSITVTKKPLFATWRKVEGKLDEFFGLP